jgi:hypothetical protein
MRGAAQRDGSGGVKVSDVNAAWGRIHVCGTPLASCGAPMSQTNNSLVASNDHKTTPRTRREGGDKARKKMHGSGEAPARTRPRHEGGIGGRRQRKCDMITRDMRLIGYTWVGARKARNVCCTLLCITSNM